MNFNPAEKNAFDALEQLLRMGKVRVTSTTLRTALSQHPDFPSLVALSDVLNEVNVPNLATRITADRLPDIPLPALAHLTIEGGFFAPIRQVTDDTIEWLHTKRGWQKQNRIDFSRIWDGVALLIEPSPESGESRYTENRRREQIANSRYPFIVLGLLVCLGFVLRYGYQQMHSGLDQSLFWLTCLKVVGTILSGFLLAYGVDSNNSLLRSICHLGNRTDCHSILNSKAAKLFSWLSWSEIGFIYFGGGLIASLLVLLLPAASVVQYLLWLNVLALPYTVYSLYYQAFVAKEFCILCTAVQLTLWLEALAGQTLWGELSSEGLGVLLFSFTLVAVLWAFIKEPLTQARQTAPLRRELLKLKFNPEYLESLFSKQRTMPPIFEGMNVVIVGNPEAPNTLTMVTNPMCGPCAKMHQEIENLLENTSDVKCEIVFSISNSAAYQVAEQVINLASEQAGRALHSWFKREDRNVEKWKASLQVTTQSEAARQQLDLHRRWCELASITGTPTLYLNGTALPSLYHIPDVTQVCRSLSLMETSFA
ncbi:vitamin K epoxide reductase family protein [Larkinella sp. VNQ87]|uniref:vitamin K epoxide reductase family protein n=1 Tax=Larkinella sp. VNQ87 TaxID=3400921 RepID=UPI003BFC9B29